MRYFFILASNPVKGCFVTDNNGGLWVCFVTIYSSERHHLRLNSIVWFLNWMYLTVNVFYIQCQSVYETDIIICVCVYTRCWIVSDTKCIVYSVIICFSINIRETDVSVTSKKGLKKQAKQAKKDERKAQTAAKLVSVNELLITYLFTPQTAIWSNC